MTNDTARFHALAHHEGAPTDAAEPPLPRATYAEDDWVAEVEILKDLGDKDHEAYRLRVVRTIQPSQIYRPVPDGNEFLCDQRRGTANRIFILTRMP